MEVKEPQVAPESQQILFQLHLKLKENLALVM